MLDATSVEVRAFVFLPNARLLNKSNSKPKTRMCKYIVHIEWKRVVPDKNKMVLKRIGSCGAIKVL